MRWAALVSIVLSVTASVARADGPYEGEWRRGPMTISVSVATWGSDCGARPESTTVPARGAVNVTQDGDHLTFGGGRTTRSCWSDNPAVRRVSSTFSSGTWRIVCRTPAEDSRQETGTYTLRATSNDVIEFRDVTEYDWQLNESHCRATSTTTQTFTRSGGGAVAEPTPTPTTEPEPSPACTAGAPARIALRPAATDVEPGGRVCFTARVVDAAGCAVRGAAPTLVLRAPAGRSGSLRGACFEAAATAAEGEGEFAVVATHTPSGGSELRTEARVRVHTMDLSDLIARRAESGDVATDPGVASSDTASGVAARAEGGPGAPTPWWALALAAVGLLLVVGTAATLASRRRARNDRLARAAARRPITEAPLAAAPAPAPIAEPAPLPAPSAVPNPPSSASAASAMICPTCRRGYAAGDKLCPRDGTALVPYAEFAQKGADAETSVCPKCGKRYAGNRRFCGEDGTTLEPIR